MTNYKQLEKKHPLAIRWLHWISFPLLTLMIWSALVAASAMAALLVWLVGFAERETLTRMGVKPS